MQALTLHNVDMWLLIIIIKIFFDDHMGA